MFKENLINTPAENRKIDAGNGKMEIKFHINGNRNNWQNLACK